jgi:hypothetical protein
LPAAIALPRVILAGMNVANFARVLVVAGACFAAVGSATSNTPSTATPPPVDPNQAQFEASSSMTGTQNTPPAARQMDAQLAMGVWRSTFGAVKLEPDSQHGGLAAGSVQGVWMYNRQGQQVVGLFYGNLRGNVLQFHWQEPAQPPLVGEGYLVFDPSGQQYSGRWWSERHDRVGEWNGWRDGMPRPGAQPQQGGQEQNGAYPQQGQQPYPQQGQQPYPQQGQQPYPPQGQQPYPPPQGQQPYAPQGQQPYPQQGQQPYPPPQGQQPYAPQGQQPYAPQGQQPYPAQPAPQQPAPQRGYY